MVHYICAFVCVCVCVSGKSILMLIMLVMVKLFECQTCLFQHTVCFRFSDDGRGKFRNENVILPNRVLMVYNICVCVCVYVCMCV